MSGGQVLVTGGAGYIGSHTVKALLNRGRDVVVLDTLESGNAAAVGSAKLCVGDIADRDLVRRLCRDHDITEVIHFAAYKSVAESMTNPGRYWDNNVVATIGLVEAARSAGVTALVFSSSAAVYGTPRWVPIDEDHPIEPESVYAATKAVVEELLTWTGRTSPLQSVSLRYFNAAGAAMDGSMGEKSAVATNLIPATMKSVVEGGPILQVYGTDYPTRDGTCIRDYVHVDDLAEAHILALDHLREGGATTAINLGTGVGSSVLEVVAAIERVAGTIVHLDSVGRREGDPVSSLACAELANSMLGWQPIHDLDDIIASAWRWHSQTGKNDRG